MAEVPTFDEIYDVGKAEVQARAPQLADWNEGSNLDGVIGGGAMLADEVVRLAIALFGEQFVDVATGSALDALALDRFGLPRLAASASIGTLRFTRGSAVGVLTIPAGTTVRGTVNGETVDVTVDEDTEMPALDDTVDALATCTVTGPDGNVSAGILTTIVDIVTDDPDLTITNPDRFAGGDVEETDPEFRDRIRRYWTTLRKGTVQALVAGATSVAGVQYATVDESFIAPEDGGYVAVYIGDPDGSANDALAALVATELEDWRAAGIEVQVLPATREEIDLALTVYCTSGIDTAELGAAIRAAVLGYTDDLAPNEKLRVSAVIAAAHEASDDVISVAVTTPTADVTPTNPQNALRVLTADLAITLVEV